MTAAAPPRPAGPGAPVLDGPPGVLDVRPLRPADRAAYVRAVSGLSARTRALRFHAPKPSMTSREVDRMLDVGHDGAEALAAWDGEVIVAIARYAPVVEEPGVGEVAIVVADAWQGRGVGDRLLRALRPPMLAAGYRVARATTQAGNEPVHRLLRAHGFRASAREHSTLTFEAAL